MIEKRSTRMRVAMLAVVAAAAAAFVWAAACPPRAHSAAAADGQAVHVTILHVNDGHGQLGGIAVEGRQVGGVARLATAVEKVRRDSQAARVFLVHCGDEFSRGDALTQRTHGIANVTIMNRLRYDMFTPGNGEFYGGVAELRRRIEQAAFPVLTANVQLADGRPLGVPYVIEQAGPVRIAFFGLCTVRKNNDTQRYLRVADAIETAKALVPTLRSQADAVAAVSHLGLKKDQQLAAAVDGIDLILGGHSHNDLPHGFRAKDPTGREVLICQAGDQYRYCGRVELEFSPREGGSGYAMSGAVAALIPLDETVTPDGEITNLLNRLGQAASRPAASSSPASVEEPAEEPALAN